jgi:hypothetical protein
MEYGGKDQSDEVNESNPGNTQDCINFAEAFLELPNSIIIGWCANHKKLIELTDEQLKPVALKKIVDDMYEHTTNGSVAPIGTDLKNASRQKHFALGAAMAEMRPNTRQVVLPRYLNWLASRWNRDAQKLVNGCIT